MEAIVLGRPVVDGMRFVIRAFADRPTRPWAKCLVDDCGESCSVQHTEDDAMEWCRFHVRQHKLPPVKLTLTVIVPALKASKAHHSLKVIARQYVSSKLVPDPLPEPLRSKR